MRRECQGGPCFSNGKEARQTGTEMAISSHRIYAKIYGHFLPASFPLLSHFFPIGIQRIGLCIASHTVTNLLNILGMKYPFKQHSSKFSTNATEPILGE